MTKRKVKKGAAKRGASKATIRAAGGSKKPADLETVRQKIAAVVAGDALDMVNDMIAEVHKGQHTPMKYLFEMIGLYPAAADEEASVDDSLIQTLLRRLGFPEHEDGKNAEPSPSTSAEAPKQNGHPTAPPVGDVADEAAVE
jgi:hypothetical protein